MGESGLEGVIADGLWVAVLREQGTEWLRVLHDFLPIVYDHACDEVDGGEVDGEIGDGLGVLSEALEGLEGVGKSAMGCARWGGEVANAQDGGLESLMGDGFVDVLLGDGFGADVEVVDVHRHAEGGDVDELRSFGKAEVDDAVGAVDVGVFDGSVGSEVACVGCAMEDGADGHGQLVGAEGLEVADDGDDACAQCLFRCSLCRREKRCVEVGKGIVQPLVGMGFVVGTDEAVDGGSRVGEQLVEEVAAEETCGSGEEKPPCLEGARGERGGVRGMFCWLVCHLCMYEQGVLLLLAPSD